ncbi:MAG: RlmE family RNA methyltransferase [Burkholderiales bacterium]
MRRHLRDPYVKQAVSRGYRSRAAFKLLELNERERLIRPGMRIVDLGAAPGGWSQLAAEKVRPGGCVVAVDLQSMKVLPDVTFIRGDVHEPAVQSSIEKALGDRRADLVLSDMAPNLTGVRPVDEARSQELAEVALAAARRLLKPGGGLLVKVFHGSGLDAVIRQMQGAFAQVGIRKPPASRSDSSEVYVVCRGLLQSVLQ